MCRRMMQSIAIKQSNESVVHSNRIYVMHIACVGSTDVVVPLLESMKHVMRTANEHRHLTLQLATLQRSISLVRIRACKVRAAWHATFLALLRAVSSRMPYSSSACQMRAARTLHPRIHRRRHAANACARQSMDAIARNQWPCAFNNCCHTTTTYRTPTHSTCELLVTVKAAAAWLSSSVASLTHVHMGFTLVDRLVI